MKTSHTILGSIALMAITLSLSFPAKVQRLSNITLQSACGKSLDTSFAAQKATHNIQINLSAGSRLSVSVKPSGDYLKLRAEIYDPNGGLIYPVKTSFPTVKEFLKARSGMFDKSAPSTLEITTGRLDANGKYTVRLMNFNYPNQPSNSGGYSAQFNCSK